MSELRHSPISASIIGDSDNDGRNELIFQNQTGQPFILYENDTETPTSLSPTTNWTTLFVPHLAIGDLDMGGAAGGGGGTYDITNYSLANNATHLYARISVNGTLDFATAGSYYRLFIGKGATSGSNVTPETGLDLPFKYDFRVQINSSACNVYNISNSSLGSCAFGNDSTTLELSVLLSLLNSTAGSVLNVSVETGSASARYDFAPDYNSFIEYLVAGEGGTPPPTDSTAPTVLINASLNNTITTDNTPTVQFNFTDAASATANCKLYMSGTEYGTASGVANNTASSITATTVPAGNHSTYINCTDLSGNTGKSATIFLAIDTTAPVPQINTSMNNTFTADDTPTISFNFTDSLSAFADCTLYVDGGSNAEVTGVNNNSASSVTASPSLSDANHSLYVSCVDLAGNAGSSGTIFLAVDTTAPVVNIDSSINNTETADDTPAVAFNFTDALSGTASCLLYFNATERASDVSVDNNTASSLTPGSSVADGIYNVIVNCTDLAGNLGASGMLNLSIDTQAETTLKVNVTTDRTSYLALETVSAQGVVAWSNGSLVEGANVTVRFYNADGMLNESNITSGPAGGYLGAYVIQPTDRNGSWSVNISASYSASTAANQSAFEVNRTLSLAGPADGSRVDRDGVDGVDPDAQNLTARVNSREAGITVTFKANLTEPLVESNIILGQAITNASGEAVYAWNGTDMLGDKVYAGNYTWWAEAAAHQPGSSSNLKIYGGLNISFRYADSKPGEAYTQGDKVMIDTLLDSLGPETRTQLNGTYLAVVNATLTDPDSSETVVQLLDPGEDEDPIRQLQSAVIQTFDGLMDYFDFGSEESPAGEEGQALQTIANTETSTTICEGGQCAVTFYASPVFFHNGTGYEPVNTTISNKSIIISGRTYDYAADRGLYSVYFRSQSSDTADRPMALVKENYILAFSPQDTISFSPRKAGVEGKVGDRQQAIPSVNGSGITYQGQYKEIGSAESFADLYYEYGITQLKEDVIIFNQSYLASRFASQCRPEDYDIVNLVIPSTIVAYHDSDIDNQTIGIRYGRARYSFKEFGMSANGQFTTSEEIYFTDENNNTIYHIPQSFAYDSNDTGRSTILLNRTVSMTDFGNLRIDLLVPFNWLNDAALTYPVHIDPSVTLNYTSADSWSAPPGVANITVEAWGGGGAGGSTVTSNLGGGGGAGGQYARKNVPVVAGQTYTIAIAAQAVHGGVADTSGPDGYNTTFSNSSTVLVRAVGGGGGGSGSSPTGGSGSRAGSIGDVVYYGGNGGIGASASGAGGGGAGSTGPGGNATTTTAGTGTSELGGSGAAGGATSSAGSPGNVYGGGGEGGRRNAQGGTGAAGFLRLVYIDEKAPSLTGVINHSITTAAAAVNWTTDEAANGTIRYGTTLALTTGSVVHSNLLTQHSLSLESLSAGQLYYYNVTSCDAAGNCNTSGPHTFSTKLECGAISQSIFLTENLSINGSTCFSIMASDVTIDCDGHALIGNDTPFTYGILTSQLNTTVKNCIITGFDYTIYLNSANGAILENNQLETVVNSSGAVALTLSNSNDARITNTSAASSFGKAVYLSGSSNNQIIGMEANSFDAPVYAVSSSNNNTFDGWNATGSSGIVLASSSENKLWNSRFWATNTVFTFDTVQNISIKNVTAGSTVGVGIWAMTCTGLNISDSTIMSNSSTALYLAECSNSLVRNLQLTGDGDSNGALRLAFASQNNTITNVTVNGLGGGRAIGMDSQANTGNIFINNTLSNATTLLELSATSGNNLFYLNNFTNIGNPTKYVSDAAGTNKYNYTTGGQNQGNIFANVIDGTIDISGTDISQQHTTLYVGSSGTAYPYNSSTSQGKFTCNFAGCGDFAPLTGQHTESHAPVMTNSAILPSPTGADDDSLQASCSATDAEGTDRLFYEYILYRNQMPYVDDTAFKSGSIEAGMHHTCAIRANDSRVLCWGRNEYGQLGTGDYDNRNVPTPTADSAAYASVSAGEYHTCGIRANDSKILCWGRNHYGQLGLGDAEGNRSSPTPISDATPFKSVTSRIYHNCAIRANDSRVMCWGDNFNGYLGTGNDTAYHTPVVTTDTSSYLSISAGEYHTCGIRANDSRILCWGANGEGELGTGNTTYQSAPVETTDASAYTHISAGNWFTCGIRANDSRVLCWGRNSEGQLGNGSSGVGKYSPTLTTDTSPYLSVSSGGYFACGLRATDNRMLCWGENDVGQLAIGNTTSYKSPRLSGDSRLFLSLSVHHSHACAVRASDSRIMCWGSNTYGQIGNGADGTDVRYATLTADSVAYAAGFSPSEEANVFNLSATLTDPGSNWTLGCRASDGTNMSSWLNSTMTQIAEGAEENHTVINSPSSLSFVLATNTSVDLSSHGQSGVKDVLVSAGNYSALLSLNFNLDIDVSSIYTNVSTAKGKAVFHNSSSVPGLMSVSLLVPNIRGSGWVYVCPGAETLDETNMACPGRVVIRTGETVAGMTVSEASYGGVDYYIVSHITGTGGGEGENPRVNINLSLNNTGFTTVTPGFDFNFTDNQSIVANCTLYIDGASYNHTVGVSNNTQTILRANASIADGAHTAYINCTTEYTTAQSDTLYVSIDTEKHWNNTFDTAGRVVGEWTVDLTAGAEWFYPVSLDDTKTFSLEGQGTNDDPTIDSVAVPSSVAPTAGLATQVAINFTATDLDGNSELNDSSARVSVTNNGVFRNGTCSPTPLNSTSKRYDCSLGMQHYDAAGIWMVNVSISDTGGPTVAFNYSTNFSYNELLYLQVSPDIFSFGTLAVGASDQASPSNPLSIDNLGNYEFSQINVTAYDLVNSSHSIGAGNFTVNTANAPGAPLVAGEMVTVSGASLAVDIDGVDQNESLYFYMSMPNVAALQYTSSSSWVITAN